MGQCTSAGLQNVVVYAGKVDILISLVFCDGNYELLFLCTLAWKGELFVLYSTNQM